MTAQAHDGSRRMLPRWRYGSRAELTAEYAGPPVSQHRTIDHGPLNEAIARFKRVANAITASEAVETAVVYGQLNLAEDAAHWLLNHPDTVAKDLLVLSQEALSPKTFNTLPASIDTVSEARRIVAANRRILRTYPRNVGRWLDLSRAYAVLGLPDQSWKSMEVALSLAPTHRVTQRVAGRLLVHLHKADEAYQLVVRNAITEYDPWLMAFEIALSDLLKQSPRFIKQARRFLRDSVVPPAHVSELASAFGTWQFRTGDVKGARKSFRLAGIAPTENTLAQLQWMNQKDSAIVLPKEQNYESSFAAEARCWRALQASKWESALRAAKEWQQDEGFSGRPAIVASYVALSILRDYEEAIRACKQGLNADSGDQLLRNNYVVALAKSSQIDTAIEEFVKIQEPYQAGYFPFVRMATAGLLAFGIGDADLGTKLYKKAAEVAEGENRLLVLAHQFNAECTFLNINNGDLEKEVRIRLEDMKDPIAKAAARSALDEGQSLIALHTSDVTKKIEATLKLSHRFDHLVLSFDKST